MLDVVSKEAKLEHRAIPGVQIERDGKHEVVYKENSNEIVVFEVVSEDKTFMERMLREVMREEKRVFVYAYGKNDTKLLKKLGFKEHVDFNGTDGNLYKRLMVAN